MGLRHIGYALDVVLLGVAGYLLAQGPLALDLRREGATALYKLADGPAYNSSSPTVAFADPVHQKWFDFVLGDNLGRYGASTPDAAAFHRLDSWLNSLVLPEAVRSALPHMLAIWLRNLLAGWAMYFVVGGLWSLTIYVLARGYFFPGDKAKEIPSWDDMKLQMTVSTQAMVLYSLMPTFGEWFIERGWTKAYLAWPELTPAGLGGYAGGIAAYIFLVEWGIYWVHRYLHDNKTLYKLLHKPHHIYNNNLTPFAGLAFHPIDGMLQASPYVLFLFALPVHFWTHLGLLFFTGIWTTNIHDTLNGDSEPIMGAGYHTLHHTTYKDNYGQFFVFFDWVHETLLPPKHRREQWGWTRKGSKAE